MNKGLTCSMCGIGFHGRSDAVYCSSACRQKAHRARAARRNAGWRQPRVLINPDIAGTIQRAHEQRSRAQDLCRTAADALRESGASYRQLMAARGLTRPDSAAAPSRPTTGLASEGHG